MIDSHYISTVDRRDQEGLLSIASLPVILFLKTSEEHYPRIYFSTIKMEQ